jgi:hypothetical protein
MKLTLSFLFKLLIFSLSTLGVYLTIKDTVYPLEALSYFTTIINILTALFYGLFTIELALRKNRSPLLRFFKQSLMVYLIMTMLVYSFVLIPYILEEQVNYRVFSGEDLLIHYVVPFVVLIDYIWFDEKGKLKSYYPFANIGNIVFYVGYLFIYVSLGGRFHFGNGLSMYPYFFLNIEQTGLYPVILICISIIFMVVFIGWVVYMIDLLVSIPLKLNQVKRK